MKCPNCNYDQKVKYGMTCGGCRYRFTFNPKAFGMHGMTDGKFTGFIRLASQNGTMYYTEQQLYAAFCKRMSRSIWPRIFGAIILFIVAGVLLSWDLGVFAFIAGVVGVGSLLSLPFRKRKTARKRFDKYLAKWVKDGKKLEMMIDHPTLDKPPPEWSEPDIYDYGVERILIVERDVLVDLLVKNGVHAEQRMLVLSESGYPKYLLPVADKLLRENPALPVFLLHDATPHGAGMRDRLMSQSELPLQGRELTDVGMFPDDFRKLKRTRAFDPGNSDRELPVDALMMPILVTGLGTVFVQGIPIADLLGPQFQQTSQSSTGFDFG